MRVLPVDVSSLRAIFNDLAAVEQASLVIDWTVFLDDAAPSRGTIDIIQEMKRLGLLGGGGAASVSVAG